MSGQFSCPFCAPALHGLDSRIRPTRPALPPELRQLLRHVALLPAQEVVRDLVETGDLDGPIAVDETTAGDALHRYSRQGDRLRTRH